MLGNKRLVLRTGMHVAKFSAKVLQMESFSKTNEMLNFSKYFGNFFCVKSFLSTFAQNLQQMKDSILQKAADMFLTLGFKSVTMDDIANGMGISKKTIYQHYATKDDLVAATTQYLFEKISAGIDCICALGKNPIEELFEIKNYVMENLKDENSSPIFQLQKYYPKVHNSMKCRQFDKMEDCVITNLKRGKEQGLYRDTIDVQFVGRIYYAGATSIKDLELFPSNMFTNRELQEKFLEYHLRGIVTPKGLEILESLLNK